MDETIAPVVSGQDSADSRLAEALFIIEKSTPACAVKNGCLTNWTQHPDHCLSLASPAWTPHLVYILEWLMADTVHELNYLQIDHVMKGPQRQETHSDLLH